MNELLIFIEIAVVFSAVVLVGRFFGKAGLIGWIGIASILANIMTAKNVDAFGMTVTLGTVLFASTFLTTDILTENYSADDAKKGVLFGALSTLCLIVSSQIALLYIPSSIDYADGFMRGLFTLNLRISISSLIMYLIANLADVFIYEKMRQKMGGKKMWLRNNVATILCNTLENFFFMGMAFYGIYEATDIIVMAVSASVIEVIAGVCDTPFLYIAAGRKKVQ